MNKRTLTLIHSPSVELEVKTEPTAYCPNDYIYFVGDKDKYISHLRTISEAEAQVNEWIRRYDNLLKGLYYWKEKALEIRK